MKIMPKTKVAVFFNKNDAKIPVERLKVFVAKNLEYAKKITGTDVKSRENRQYLVGQACRYELELIRRGLIGDVPEKSTDLTDEQRSDLEAFFGRYGGGSTTLPNEDVLPDIEGGEEAPPRGLELEENIYHYECGCIYNLTKREWVGHCPLWADGRCPQASPKREDKRDCSCVWPAHCNKCEEEYVRWWRNQAAEDMLLGVRRDVLLNEEGKLSSDYPNRVKQAKEASRRLDKMAQEDDERYRQQIADLSKADDAEYAALAEFESEGGSLAVREALTDADRRVLARAAAQDNSSPLSGLFIGSFILIAVMLLYGAYAEANVEKVPTAYHLSQEVR
jgi:hypothetical protein